MDMKETARWLSTAYDKLILVCVLLGLLASSFFLYSRVGREKTSLARTKAGGPHGPIHEVAAVNSDWVENTIEALAAPQQIPEWTNKMMMPEIRVLCVSCRRPIPYDAEICPFRNCQAKQPSASDDTEKDSDFDGIPDTWEKEHGFNPFNSDDAHQDADGDGFTNLEEYLFGTDPRDPESCPPPVAKLQLTRTGHLPMPLSFQGTSQTPDGEMIFTMRHVTKGRDYYVRQGQQVEGYQVVDYKPKTQEVVRPGVSLPVTEDVSVLTLRRNDKDFNLTIYKQEHRGELAAELLFLLDDAKFLVTVGDTITLKKNEYKIVDITSNIVIVRDIATGLEVSVERPGEI